MISPSVRTYSIFALATSSTSSAVSLSARAASFSACFPAASTLAAASLVARRRRLGARLLDAAHVGRRRRLLRLGVRQAALAEGQVRGRALVVAARLLLLLQLAGDLLLLGPLRRGLAMGSAGTPPQSWTPRPACTSPPRASRGSGRAPWRAAPPCDPSRPGPRASWSSACAPPRRLRPAGRSPCPAQAPPLDVPSRQLRRRHHRALVDLDRVVLLVLRPQAAQDGDGLRLVRFRHRDLLEPALERGVLLDGLLELLGGGRARCT